MIVIICGGRNYSDKIFLFTEMDKIHAQSPITLVLNGKARGADSLGRDWARTRGVAISDYPANWKRDGNAAGPIRNALMLDDLRNMEGEKAVIAFMGGRGTENMMRIAHAAGVEVRKVGW